MGKLPHLSVLQSSAYKSTGLLTLSEMKKKNIPGRPWTAFTLMSKTFDWAHICDTCDVTCYNPCLPMSLCWSSGGRKCLPGEENTTRAYLCLCVGALAEGSVLPEEENTEQASTRSNSRPGAASPQTGTCAPGPPRSDTCGKTEPGDVDQV